MSTKSRSGAGAATAATTADAKTIDNASEDLDENSMSLLSRLKKTPSGEDRRAIAAIKSRIEQRNEKRAEREEASYKQPINFADMASVGSS